ncbi:hypothetical protein PSPO01_03595 [Paraphaeosphaeria sporulosa]
MINSKLSNTSLSEGRLMRKHYGSEEKKIEKNLEASQLLTNNRILRHSREAQNPDVRYKVQGKVLPNAKHWKLSGFGDSKLRELGYWTNDKGQSQRNWEGLMKKPEFTTLLDKPLIIIHCSESVSRTPIFASFTQWYKFAKNDSNRQELLAKWKAT